MIFRHSFSENTGQNWVRGKKDSVQGNGENKWKVVESQTIGHSKSILNTYPTLLTCDIGLTEGPGSPRGVPDRSSR